MWNILNTFINISIQVSILILLVLVIRIAIRKFPKIYTYILWLLVVARALIPVSFESTIGIVPSISVVEETHLQDETPVQDTDGSSLVSNLTTDDGTGHIANTYSPEIIHNNPNIATDYTYPVSDENPSTRTDTVTAENTKTERSSGSGGWNIITTVFTIWISGVAGMLALIVTKYVLIKKSLRTATKVQGNVWESEAVDSPFVIGIIRPGIYLPYGLDEKEKSFIVLHEKTHIKHLDPQVRLIVSLALCIHWWNPLVWIASFVMKKDMEMWCDESVLASSMIDEKKEYANALLNHACKKSGIIPMVSFGESGVEGRIKHIFRVHKPKIIIAAVIVLVIAGCTVFAFTVKKETEYTKVENALCSGFEVYSYTEDGKDYFEYRGLYNITITEPVGENVIDIANSHNRVSQDICTSINQKDNENNVSTEDILSFQDVTGDGVDELIIHISYKDEDISYDTLDIYSVETLEKINIQSEPAKEQNSFYDFHGYFDELDYVFGTQGSEFANQDYDGDGIYDHMYVEYDMDAKVFMIYFVPGNDKKMYKMTEVESYGLVMGVNVTGCDLTKNGQNEIVLSIYGTSTAHELCYIYCLTYENGEYVELALPDQEFTLDTYRENEHIIFHDQENGFEMEYWEDCQYYIDNNYMIYNGYGNIVFGKSDCMSLITYNGRTALECKYWIGDKWKNLVLHRIMEYADGQWNSADMYIEANMQTYIMCPGEYTLEQIYGGYSNYFNTYFDANKFFQGDKEHILRLSAGCYDNKIVAFAKRDNYDVLWNLSYDAVAQRKALYICHYDNDDYLLQIDDEGTYQYKLFNIYASGGINIIDEGSADGTESGVIAEYLEDSEIVFDNLDGELKMNISELPYAEKTREIEIVQSIIKDTGIQMNYRVNNYDGVTLGIIIVVYDYNEDTLEKMQGIKQRIIDATGVEEVHLRVYSDENGNTVEVW